MEGKDLVFEAMEEGLSSMSILFLNFIDFFYFFCPFFRSLSGKSLIIELENKSSENWKKKKGLFYWNWNGKHYILNDIDSKEKEKEKIS